MLIEAKTYRYRGHFEGDQEPYRSEEEKEEWRAERDPVDNFRASLTERGELDDGAFESLWAKVRAEIDEAVAFARESLEPAPYEAYEEVFADPAPEVEAFRERMQTDDGRPGGEY